MRKTDGSHAPSLRQLCTVGGRPSGMLPRASVTRDDGGVAREGRLVGREPELAALAELVEDAGAVGVG